MSGVKGRSGRKAWSVEERIHHLRNKAVETTLAYLNSDEPLSERAKIAAQHSVREVTDKQANTGTPEKVVIVSIEKSTNRMNIDTPSINNLPSE